MSTTITNNNARRIISDVLDIENSGAWTIVSSDEDSVIHMIHHRAEADLKRHGDLRGIVVDTEAKTIVSKSYGYAPTVRSDELVIGEDGYINLTDENGDKHVVDPLHTNFKLGFEGTLISVFKHNGKVYRVTRKRLDASRSRWGSSKTFTEMYWDLGGPSDYDLFSEESDYSPYCHNFIIVHPDVLVVSKENVGNGYLVYMGPKQLWTMDYKNCPYKQVQHDGTLFWNTDQEEFDSDPRPNAGWIDETLYLPTVSSVRCEGTIYHPPNLDLESSNHHLTFGFYPGFEGFDSLDRRTLPGEFIILDLLDSKGETAQMLRVESTAYTWRSSIRDNNPNLLNQFYRLVSGSYITDQNKYNRLYPTFTPYDIDSISSRVKDEPYIMWPQDRDFDDSEYLTTKESRMTNIWIAFLNSVPPHKQREVSGYIKKLYNKRGELIKFIRRLSGSKISHEDFSKRMLSILSLTKKFAEESASKGDNVDKNGQTVSIKMMTNRNIKKFIMREEGYSLYRLVREMDRWNKEQQQLKDQQE